MGCSTIGSSAGILCSTVRAIKQHGFFFGNRASNSLPPMAERHEYVTKPVNKASQSPDRRNGKSIGRVAMKLLARPCWPDGGQNIVYQISASMGGSNLLGGSCTFIGRNLQHWGNRASGKTGEVKKMFI
jgi:hypothetical protein